MIVVFGGFIVYDLVHYHVVGRQWMVEEGWLASFGDCGYRNTGFCTFDVGYRYNGASYIVRRSLPRSYRDRARALTMGEDTKSIRVPIKINPLKPEDMVVDPTESVQRNGWFFLGGILILLLVRFYRSFLTKKI